MNKKTSIADAMCIKDVIQMCESKFDAAEAKQNKNKRTRKTVPSVNRTRNTYSST
jgi:hypothetical protein